MLRFNWEVVETGIYVTALGKSMATDMELSDVHSISLISH